MVRRDRDGVSHGIVPVVARNPVITAFSGAAPLVGSDTVSLFG